MPTLEEKLNARFNRAPSTLDEKLRAVFPAPSENTLVLKNRRAPKVDKPELQRSGIFGDLFDLLGRTGAASAQGAYNATDNDTDTTFLGGLKQGITGNSRTSYRDVLRDNAGVGGPFGTALGLVGDIALDPLTYLGIKGTKGITQTDAIMKALKSTSDDVPGAVAGLMAKSPTRVGLTFAGKPFTKGLKLPSTGFVEKLLGPVEDRKLAAKMFSRDAELALGLNDLSRVIESSHAAGFDSFHRGLKGLFSDLTMDERSNVGRALSMGEDLASTPTEAVGKTKFATLGEYVKSARNMQDQFFNDEVALGIRKADDYMPNYVPKIFQKPPKDLIPGNLAPSKLAALKKSLPTKLDDLADYEPVTDVIELLDVRAAKHFRTMALGTTVRDTVEQFAIPKARLAKAKGLKDLGWVKASSLDHPVAKLAGEDLMVPGFVAKGMGQFTKTFKDPTVGAEAMKLYDKALGHWKYLNTAVKPGYHVRNSFSDLLMNMADGVVNPHRYDQAFRVMADRKNINEGFVAGLSRAEDIPRKAFSKLKLNGKDYSSSDIYDAYVKSGSKSGLITSEIQRSMSDFERNVITKQLSRTKAKVGDWSDAREDYFRMAHFLDASDKLMKKTGKTLDEVSLDVGKSVRKYNIDYGNLSTFEKNTVNKIIPFYSWMRRATPLNVELMFTKPGFMALYPKMQNAVQGFMGTEDGQRESLLPDWIKGMAPVRMAVGKEADRNWVQRVLAGAAGAGDNEAVFLSTTQGTTPFDTLDLPAEPIRQLLQGNFGAAARAPIADLGQSLTPFLKAPVEITTGKNMFTGQDIDNWSDWLANQVSPVGAINKATEGNRTSLISALAGVPLQVSTAGRQEGEFNRQQDIVQSNKRADKLKLLRSRFPNYDELSEARKEKLASGVRSKTDPETRAQRRYLTQILGQ